MAIDFNNAVQAYDRAARSSTAQGADARDTVDRPSFGDVLKEATETVSGQLRETEAQTLKAATGNASLDDVVVAVTQAELTLNTVVAVRDKVIQAYQEIVRMPI